MYVFVLILVTMSVVDSCQPPPCHWKGPKQILDYFENTANQMVVADRKAEDYCYDHRTNEREIHGDDFQYIIQIPEGTRSDFKVKSRNRVVLIEGNVTGGKVCNGYISHLKILPDYVDPKRASWQFWNNELIVTVPFSRANGANRACTPVDEMIRSIPCKCNKH